MRHFRLAFLNVDNCQPNVVSDVIPELINLDVGMNVCANFGYSRLKPSEASFSALFHTWISLPTGKT